MKTRPLFILAFIAGLTCYAQQERGRGRGGERMKPGAQEIQVPAHPYDLILGRPTKTDVTLSILAYQNREGFVTYGTSPDKLTEKTRDASLKAGEPIAVVLSPLVADTRYFYQFHSRIEGAKELEHGPVCSFATARAPGSAFTFTLQADSHLDPGTSPDVYRQSLANSLAAKPDFHIDLGDTFMCDKYENYQDAAPQYLSQRYYFGLIGHSAPVFLVLGNHDGETVDKHGDGPDSMAVWSNTLRKRYFPNPVPNGFYTGNSTPHPDAGLLEDYYAWVWGDAQFIVLDPFWFTTGRCREGDNWPRSLGRGQYDWLKRTLENSHSKFKFVFIHHLAGGESREGRGGAEAAKYFEWGGRNLYGTDVFKDKRPGWPKPVHQLLLDHGVSAVFHGHDHLYVKQELDGIIYQEVPQPSSTRGSTRSAEEYGYKSGTLLPSPGVLRVDVTPTLATVRFLGIRPGKEEPAPVLDSYTIRPGEK
jgi:predicted phosphodiesterase